MIRWLVQAADADPDISRGAAPGGLLSADEVGRFTALRVAKRRHDWLLGRWTAKNLLQATLIQTRQQPVPLDRIEIHNDEAGAPFACLLGGEAGSGRAERLPLSLSISHSGDRAFCAAHWCGDAADHGGMASAITIGCDIERIEPRAASFVRAYLTAGEAAAVSAAPVSLRPLCVTALWSAKEAVLKAWRIGLRVDTRTVDCDLGAVEPGWQRTGAPYTEDDNPWRRFSVQVGEELSQLAAPATRLDGWWRISDGFVMTLAVRHSA